MNSNYMYYSLTYPQNKQEKMLNLLKKLLQKWVYFMDFIQQSEFIVKCKHYILS